MSLQQTQARPKKDNLKQLGSYFNDDRTTYVSADVCIHHGAETT